MTSGLIKPSSSLGRLASTLRFVLDHPLNRGRQLAALGRYCAWQASSHLGGERQVQWVEGSRLAIRRGMTGATGNIYCGLHEFVEMAFLLHLLRPGDLFLDVGANVGSYSVLASKVCGARTIAFEPDPQSALALRRNIELNDLEALVVVQQAAAGGEAGEIGFTVGLGPMNRIASTLEQKVQVVPVVRLDEVEGASSPALIKLDVEGFEEQVLRGASRILSSPSLLAIETEQQGPAVERALASFGFAPIYYDPFSRALADRPWRHKISNGLFVRRLEDVKSRLQQAPLRKVLGRSF